MVLSTTRSTLRNTDVLVVGGGIAGLSAAVFLAQQGVDCLLVERRAELSGHPRARGVHPRAMELMRAAGVEDELRATPSARLLADNSGVIAATSLAGPELGVLDEKYVMDVGADIGSLSPTGWCLCHQGELEDVLRARAERLGVALRFSTELVSFDQNGAGLTARLRDRTTGADRTIGARYLVAADGAHSGIRDTLGIAFDGETLGHYLNIHFDADLTEPLGGRRFLMCYTAGEGVRGALVPLDNATEWLLHVAYDPETTEPESFTEERCAELVRAAAGVPGLRPRIRSVSPWDGAARTAGRFRDGRVFLVGDAAHVMPPSGGFGSSTGIQDAHNLAWKLAAVVAGWAGEALLDSYDEERRPICRATVEQAALRSKDRPRLTGGADGTGERPPVHPGIVEDAQVWLSWRYRSSAVTAWDEGVLPGYGVWSAENDGRPGGRAPHLRLRRGGAELSVLDLFGDRPVLLTGPDNRAWQEAARAVAHELDLPLTVHGIGAELVDVDDRWPELYGVTAQGAVLVRPDGVVAWRCADAPIFARDTLRAVLVRLLAR